MAKTTKHVVANATQGMAAVGALSVVGLLFTTLLIVALIAGLYERARIDTQVPLAVSDIASPDDLAEGFAAGRHPSQPRGSAVIPAVPNDPRRQGHTRLQVAHNLREAASTVLDTHAAIHKARQHDRYLGALYASERTKVATSIVRRELAVVGLLALGGVMAVWGLQ